MEAYNLMNKVVLITGGSNGIGEQLVDQFVKKGANVVFIDIDEKKGKIVEKKLSGKAEFVKADISDAVQVRQALAKIIDKYKKINILINNAGVMRSGKFVETPFEDVISVNLIGTMTITQLVLPFMEKQDKIMNVLSTYGFMVRQNKISYDVSNAGLLMFTQTLAKELKQSGITVNALSFTSANTNMLKQQPKTKNESHVFEAKEVAQHIINIVENFSPQTTGSNFVIDAGI